MEDLKLLVDEFLNRSFSVAVVGASTNPEKWGYKLYKFFKEAGFRKVYAVNPNAERIDGDRVYPSVSSLPEVPDVVDIVVRPEISEKVVEECIKIGVKRIWFQPGSDSEKAIDLCRRAGIKFVHGACMMEEGKKRGIDKPIFKARAGTL